MGGESWDSENVVCDNISSDAMRNKVLVYQHKPPFLGVIGRSQTVFMC